MGAVGLLPSVSVNSGMSSVGTFGRFNPAKVGTLGKTKFGSTGMLTRLRFGAVGTRALKGSGRGMLTNRGAAAVNVGASPITTGVIVPMLGSVGAIGNVAVKPVGSVGAAPMSVNTILGIGIDGMVNNGKSTPKLPNVEIALRAAVCEVCANDSALAM